MLARWTRRVVRFRNLVLALWVTVAVLGLLARGPLDARLTTSLSVPGTGSALADRILTEQFGDNIEGSFAIVTTVGHETAAQVADVEKRIKHVVRGVDTARVVEQQRVGRFLISSVTDRLDLAQASAQTSTLRQALTHVGVPSLVTGPPALQHDVTPLLGRDLAMGTVVALLGALVILGLFFGWGWASVAPLVVAGLTTAASIGVVYLLSLGVLMVLYVPNVVELVALGLAIDYTVLIVHRHRAQLAAGDDPGLALERTMSTAGRTVCYSGLAVAVGLATLCLVPVPFVRSLGVAGLVVPLVAVGSALSLQPALLSLLGARSAQDWPHRRLGGRAGVRTWSWVAQLSARWPLVVLIASLAVAGILAAYGPSMHLTPGSVTAVPDNLASTRADTELAKSAGIGSLSPFEIVIQSHSSVSAPNEGAAVERLAREVLVDPDVNLVAIGTRWPYISPSGRAERVIVVDDASLGAPQSQGLVERIRSQYVPAARFPKGTVVVVGGAAAQGVDFLHRIEGSMAVMVPLALLLALGVLWWALDSLVLATLAVALDILSVAATFGALVLAFHDGWAHAILGDYRVGQIEGWVPVFVLAVVFGLSMDYELFIASRIREARSRGATTREAVVEGLGTTGGLVSAAAAVMVVSMAGLVFGQVAGLQEAGVGLAVGVAFDALVIRGLILPSTMVLLGDRCWRGSRPRRTDPR